MKVVKKFKNLITSKRPRGLEGIFGRDTRIVQPPLSMESSQPSKPAMPQKSRSMDIHDRRPLEGGLVAEGVHREPEPEHHQGPLERREDAAIAFEPEMPSRSSTNKSEALDSSSPVSSKRDLDADPGAHRISHAATFPVAIPHRGRGQAHDPLSDHLYLGLGTGISSQPPSPPTMSESPQAAEFDIYETAYRKEVERIRASQGRSATLFLTRRVEKMGEYLKDQGLISGKGEAPAHPFGGISKVLEAARSKAAKDTAEDDHAKDTAGDDGA